MEAGSFLFVENKRKEKVDVRDIPLTPSSDSEDDGKHSASGYPFKRQNLGATPSYPDRG